MVQRIRDGHLDDAPICFSILYRIVGGATARTIISIAAAGLFQYPLSDRGWCNRISMSTTTWTGTVSVSSIGSWVVQLELRKSLLSIHSRFSILYRIVGGATKEAFITTYTASCFSILYRIVGGATDDRKTTPHHSRCFSILYRIVGGATTRSICWIWTSCLFQYPLSDRGWCNCNFTVKIQPLFIFGGSWGLPRAFFTLLSNFNSTCSANPFLLEKAGDLRQPGDNECSA